VSAAQRFERLELLERFEQLSMITPSSSTDPIFILGISQRSGTNFLFDLLRLHPDCGAPSIKWEDFLVDKSDLLVRYVSAVFPGWRRRGTDPKVEDLLYEQLGNGLIAVLTSRITAKRLVTKTPSVRNLNYFFKLFPRAYLLILVRDGRAVVESAVRTFGDSYETAMRKWARGADTILRFRQGADGLHANYLVVRYEDLWNKPEEELRRIFPVVGLDPGKYDFNAAINLPVRGSSTFHGKEEQRYHWMPVEKTADFDPLGRANNWSRSTHERFDWIAGEKLSSLGYVEKSHKEKALFWVAWNRILDLWWQFGELFQFTIKLAKDALKWMFGAERMSRYRRQVLGSIKTILKLRFLGFRVANRRGADHPE
jgi:protein-tyrosine sulfotransferase